MKTLIFSVLASFLLILPSCKHTNRPKTQNLPLNFESADSSETELDTIPVSDKIKQFFTITNTKKRLQLVDTSLFDTIKLKKLLPQISDIKQITTIYLILPYKTYFKLFFVQARTNQGAVKNFLVKVFSLENKIEDIKLIPDKIPPNSAVNQLLSQVFEAHLDTIPTVIQDRGEFQVQSIGSSQWPLVDTLEYMDQFYTRFGQDSFITYKFSFLDLYQDWQDRDLERWFWIFYYKLSHNKLLNLKNIDIFHSEGEDNVPLLFDIISVGKYDFLYGQQTFVDYDKEVLHTTYKYYLHPDGTAALWLKNEVYTDNGDTTQALITNTSFYLSNGTPIAKIKLTAIDHNKHNSVILKFKYDFQAKKFKAMDTLSQKNLNNLQNDTAFVLDILE